MIDYDSPDFSILPRAFLVAGSKAVVFSNWNIETLSASEVSQNLFQIMWLNEETSYHEALRLALIKMLEESKNKSYIHPRYWAGYSIAYSDI